MTMSKERKIIQYAIDEKTYKSLQIQFHHDLVYNMVYSKIFAYLNKMQYLCRKFNINQFKNNNHYDRRIKTNITIPI